MESESKIDISCLMFIFYQKNFYDKMDLRFFYFHVPIWLISHKSCDSVAYVAALAC